MNPDLDVSPKCNVCGKECEIDEAYLEIENSDTGENLCYCEAHAVIMFPELAE